MKEEYTVLEYNQTTTEVELVNVSASWDEVCACLYLYILLNWCPITFILCIFIRL